MNNNNDKLSVRNKTRFKNTNLITRQKTILKKALELSILCDNEICVIHYDREGNLVETYPEEQSKVEDILGSYNSLGDREKLKKNTNLSQFCNKKLVDEKKRSLTNAEEHNKFTKKVGEFEGSLVDQFHILQDRMINIIRPQPSPSLDVISEKDHNFPASSGFTLANDLDQQQQETRSVMNLLMSGDHHVSASTDQQYLLSPPSSSSSTACSLNQQSKFSVFVFNHETATFTQLPNSVSSRFDQGLTPYTNNLSTGLHGAQGSNFVYDHNLNAQEFNFGCNNNLCT
ncbi:unnamed protein product [Eruca vesicaria subsp. sativa]|uniref:MADS-box domain-containing protein n=1 Tax=Eruca vesicaria subsp. sativa TaxID=29727 RepID=A0ABC8KNZ1_ERUVS|nr:unnamed protein product [Eruca vesicaria subsp. sativa]